MLNKEIKINKFFIIILLLVCVITLGLYTSYAYYEVSVIKNGVVVIKTGTFDITTEVVDKTNNTFTIPASSNITVTVNLTTDLTNEIGYKMYYEVISGISTFNVTSTTTFTNDIVEANMTSSKQLQFTFTNLGSNDLTIKLGTKGGFANYPIPLDEGLELKVNTTLGVPVKNAIVESVNNPSDSSCKTYVEEDGITYISGTKTCINFNYVWYSGKLWRITAIHPDGTMKMITDDAITTISYGSNVNFYTDNENKSYMYQWLNEDFLDTLYNYENIIVTDSKWNSLTTTSISTKITEGAEGVTTTTSPVGLLNSYEYYMSYKNTSSGNGYLNIGYYWWLLNPYSTSYVWGVDSGGYGFSIGPTYTFGGRPSINLKSGIQLSGGSGTKTDPYTIVGDKEKVTSGTTLLNTRSSGEYVKFNNELYRIVSIENEITKINKNDYVRDTSNNVLNKQFSTSVTYGGGTTDDYWDYYLNNTWYNALDSTSQNMIVESTYYIGTNTGSTGYKKAICATASNTVTTKDCEKTTSTWVGLVGLPRYGEMFASQQGSGYSLSSNMWLMNPYSTSYVWRVYNDGGGGNYYGPTNACGGRPSINLKSNIKITGGKGTKDNPFEISE
ncbi:MAG: hypothetical protein ACI4PE_03680 [Bacilli bacterium]